MAWEPGRRRNLLCVSDLMKTRPLILRFVQNESSCLSVFSAFFRVFSMTTGKASSQAPSDFVPVLTPLFVPWNPDQWDRVARNGPGLETYRFHRVLRNINHWP